MSSIKLDSITKEFGETRALDGVNLKLEGGCTAILGPNGAGKTTMMKILTRIVRPTSGKVFVNGRDLTEFPEISLQSIGSLVEQPEFYPYLTGREVLTFVCRVKGIPKGKVREETGRVAQMCGVTSFLDRKTGGYSRGMKQRLGLALTLVSDPDILILDEPTFGLDPKGIVEMRNIIKDYSRKDGKTVMLSTHLISEATEISDRIVILDMGNIKYDSAVEAHSKKLLVKFEEPPRSLPENGIVASMEQKNELTAIFEILPSARNSDLIQILSSNGMKIRSMTETLGIEEIYMSIMNAHPRLDKL